MWLHWSYHSGENLSRWWTDLVAQHVSIKVFGILFRKLHVSIIINFVFSILFELERDEAEIIKERD